MPELAMSSMGMEGNSGTSLPSVSGIGVGGASKDWSSLSRNAGSKDGGGESGSTSISRIRRLISALARRGSMGRGMVTSWRGKL